MGWRRRSGLLDVVVAASVGIQRPRNGGGDLTIRGS